MAKTADQRHISLIHGKIAKAVKEYGLIQDKEKVLVAVSGGKDSLVLLDSLIQIRKYIPITFDLEAIHIDVENVPYKIDTDFIKKMCDPHEVPFHVKTIKVDFESRKSNTKCFACSWNRRKELFTFTVENKFQKIAFGHHMDDALETLLINMAYHANISSMPASLSMFKDQLTLIRPLILLQGGQLQRYADIKNLKGLRSECPFEDKTKRKIAGDILKEFKQFHPKYKQNMMNSMSKIDYDYLPKNIK